MILDSVAKFKAAFFRLTGTDSDDQSLTENSEATDDVFYLYLNRGFRAAQHYMIDAGMSNRWRARSSALSFTGTESADGGQHADLPDDFLRLWGDQNRSSIVQANGTTWGTEIDETKSSLIGQYYYLKNEQLWKVRGATPPTPAYMEYHFIHPIITSATTTFDFPEEGRPLCVAFAVQDAMYEGWFERQDKDAIREAVLVAKNEAKQVVRRTRQPIRMRPPLRAGTHW